MILLLLVNPKLIFLDSPAKEADIRISKNSCAVTISFMDGQHSGIWGPISIH